MKSIHHTFYTSEEYRPTNVITEGEGIPLIDLSPITIRERWAGSNHKVVEELAAKIGEGLQDLGILHGDQPWRAFRYSEKN